MIKPALALQIQKCFFFKISIKLHHNCIAVYTNIIFTKSPVQYILKYELVLKKPEKYIISHQDLLMLTICNTNARALWNSRNRQKTCTQLSQNIPTNDRGNPNFYAQSITILKHCMMSLAPENSLWLSCVGICGGQTGRVWTNV